MIYDFERDSGNLYKIEAENKIYRLLMEIAIAHFEEGKALSVVYLLDENDQVVCKVSYPFSYQFKCRREGFDVVEEMLNELAEEAKKVTKIDLLETFKEIRKEMKSAQTRT